MPRDRVVTQALQPASSSFSRPPGGALIASASRKDLRESGQKRLKKIRVDDWQQRCWYYYDVLGEYAFACNWVGNLISKAKLIVLKNGKPVQSGAANDILASLFGGPQGQTEALRKIGVHLTVAGEVYVVAEEQGSNGDKWDIVANSKIKAAGDGWKIGDRSLTSPLVCRVWRPHPVETEAATSPSRAVLPILSQLEKLGMRVAADSDSRLTNAGIILFPSETSFPSTPQQGGTDSEPTIAREGADGILDMFIDVSEIAIADPESASARIPIPMLMPGESIANVRHITFWSEYDAQIQSLSTEQIRRIALGMDMPPEALTGTGDMNHWNAWQLEEAAVKVHTEPLLRLIEDAFTTGLLRPLLESGNMSAEDAKAYSISSDTSELRLRPNRSKEAQELYDRGALSLETMLVENGFTKEQAMPAKELQDWFLRKVASGSTTPELVAEALRALKVPMDIPEFIATPVTEAPSQPSLKGHPTQDTPDPDDSEAEPSRVPAPLLAAAEVLVYRATERAGNRLKNKLKGMTPPAGTSAADLYRFVPYDPADIDDLLVDAWGPCDTLGLAFCADQLDSYTRTLLATKKPHDRELLASYLDSAPVSGS